MNEFNKMRALLQKLRDAKEAKGSFCMMDLIEWLEGKPGLTSDLDTMGYLLDQAQMDYEQLSFKSIKEVAIAS